MSMHPRPIGHISIGVRNYDASKAFYTAVLTPIGLGLVYDSEAGQPSGQKPRTLGYGPSEEFEMVNIFEYTNEASAPGRGSHIAFNASSRKAVEEFHAAALVNGGKSNGEPGLRVHYGPNYFAAFVIDPDGWRLEAVCKNKEEASS